MLASLTFLHIVPVFVDVALQSFLRRSYSGILGGENIDDDAFDVSKKDLAFILVIISRGKSPIMVDNTFLGVVDWFFLKLQLRVELLDALKLFQMVRVIRHPDHGPKDLDFFLIPRRLDFILKHRDDRWDLLQLDL